MYPRRISRPLAALPALAAGLALAAPADAQKPTFTHTDKKTAGLEEVKGVEWKASAQAGFILTTGNSRTTTLSSGLSASRKAGNDKLSLDAGGAFARSRILIAADDNGDGVLSAGEIQSVSDTTARAWFAKLRYDRFLTEHNALYITAIASADEPAGKDFVGGGQAGYSRQVYKSEEHELLGEAGYDFSHENLAVGDPLSIHSGRLFAGYKGRLTKETGFSGSLEFLVNVNELQGAQGPIESFQDRRTTAVLSLTTKLFEDVSFRFGVTAHHDSAPAPRPALSIPYETGFVPLADELDTRTEATLIVNVL